MNWICINYIGANTAATAALCCPIQKSSLVFNTYIRWIFLLQTNGFHLKWIHSFSPWKRLAFSAQLLCIYTRVIHIHPCHVTMWQYDTHKICRFVQKKAKIFVTQTQRNHRNTTNVWIYYFTSIKANRTYKFSAEKEIIYFVERRQINHTFVCFPAQFSQIHTSSLETIAMQTHCYLPHWTNADRKFIFGKWKNMSPIAYAHTFIFVENTIRVFVFALNFNIYTFFSRPTDEHYTCVYASGYLTVLEIRKFLSYSSIDRTL